MCCLLRLTPWRWIIWLVLFCVNKLSTVECWYDNWFIIVVSDLYIRIRTANNTCMERLPRTPLSSVYTKSLKMCSCDPMQSCERLHQNYSFVSGHSEQAELTTQHGTHPVENFVAGMLSPSSPEHMHGETTSVYTKPLKRRSCDPMQSCERLHHYYSFVSGHSEQAQHGTHPVLNVTERTLWLAC